MTETNRFIVFIVLFDPDWLNMEKFLHMEIKQIINALRKDGYLG